MADEISDDMLALEEAATAAGGYGALASKIGVATSAPSMWKARGRIPAEHCPAIERATGVKCERLNPGVEWKVLRATAGKSKHAARAH
jgi:DNA-binding transcriptional regulator YdaS (Cro superfamily)